MNDIFDQMAKLMAAQLSPISKADIAGHVEVMQTLTLTINKHIEAMRQMTDTLVACVAKLEEAGVFKKPEPPDEGLIN